MPAPIRSPPRTSAGSEPGAEEQWSDSFYFGGGDGRGLAFYSRIGRRPNEGVTEGALGIWLPGRDSCSRSPRAARRTTSSLRRRSMFECLRAAALWELRFDGSGRLFERAEHVATDRERLREVEVHGSCASPPGASPLSFRLRPLERGREPPLRAARLGRGRARGRRTAGSPLAGQGMRDHSWGVRDWQRVPYWRWFGLVADPDNFVMLNNVGLDDGGETAGGFLMRDGELAPIVACETESELDPELGCQRSFSARATRRARARDAARGPRAGGRAASAAPRRSPHARERGR